jgi:hypothetical protein
MDAAHLAERVLRGTGVELVGRKIVLSADQFELCGRHDQMQKPLLVADRAVAFRDAIEFGGHAKAHPTAVAAAFECLHR